MYIALTPLAEIVYKCTLGTLGPLTIYKNRNQDLKKGEDNNLRPKAVKYFLAIPSRFRQNPPPLKWINQ